MTDNARSGTLLADLEALASRGHAAAERIAAELSFAEGLLRLHPKRAARWGRLIDRAYEAMADAAASGRADRIGGAVRKAEDLLAPLGKTAKRYTAHCVGHAHIDMNWMWSWPETVAVTIDTFLTVLKLMDEFDDFCFTQSQASVYAIVREHHPEALERIKRRVAEGRWEVAAVHWVEGDKNIVSGESLARHLLYTRAFTEELFGLGAAELPLDWEPDTFGHAASIPSIVAAGGVKYYYMCRGGDFAKPPVFWWAGPDGRRVLVNLETTWYNGTIGPHNAEALLAFCEKTGLRQWLNVYGVGDHGGGPTRRDILNCREMDTWPIFPRFRLTTTGDYYKSLQKHADELPTLTGELNFEFTGCYSSQGRIKQAVALGQDLCLETEAAAAMAYGALGRPYPARKIRDAWIDTIFGHFHDILPGSGVAATREYQLALFQKAAAAANAIRTNSLRALAAAIDTSFASGPADDEARHSTAMGAGAGRGAMMGGPSAAGHVDAGHRTIVIFNPNAWDRDEVVHATVWDAETPTPRGRELKKQFVVRMPDGTALPAQRTGEGRYWGHNYVELALPAAVGAMGYSSLALAEAGRLPGRSAFPAAALPAAEADRSVKVGGGFRGGERQPVGAMTMENNLLAVAFDPATGGICSLVDKACGIDLADAADPMGVLEYVLERPRGMSAWIIGHAKRRICPLEVDSLDLTQRGPYVGSVTAQIKLNGSRITLTYTLRAGMGQLEIDISAKWVEIGGPETGVPSLRIQFPMAITGAKGLYEIPFGAIERDRRGGQEVPALRWADVTGKAVGSRRQAGCALLNDCKHGHSLDGSTLRLTLIRSTYEPDPLPEVGLHTIRLALVPHSRRPPVARLVRLAADWHHPLLVVPADAHGGHLPPACCGIGPCTAPGVVISAVKKAETADALIVRLHETAGRSATAAVAVNADLLRTVLAAEEVDLLERPVGQSSARPTAEGFGVRLGPHAIVSVRLTFAPRGPGGDENEAPGPDAENAAQER